MASPSKIKRLALVVYGLGAGGTERIVTTLANAWAAEGRHVIIVTLQAPDHVPFFETHPAVVFEHLGTAVARTSILSALGANITRIRRLRSALRRIAPDRVIAFADTVNIITILAGLGLGVPVLISQRVSPAHHPLPWPWKFLRWAFYRFASLTVAQTASMSREMPYAPYTVVIPNPVLPASERAAAIAGQSTPRPCMVSLGRLSSQKRYDLLIHAFAMVAGRWPDWTLHIYGEGPQRNELNALISTLNLDRRAILHGNAKLATSALSGADIFVSSSDYEGFPNALCEAMAHAVAVISTDCPTGPSDIITDGLNGLLVPPDDAQSLATAMERLMGDEALRHTLGKMGKQRISQYSMSEIIAQWDDAFERSA